MEQDFIAALHQCLGMSVGAEFSTEDVSLLFSKVFHASSNRGEAEAAMKKVAGGDGHWSCAGANVLDVLLEMQREKERKEMFYWDCQLLNSGNLHRLLRNMLHEKDTELFRNAFSSESGLLKQQSAETHIFQNENALGKQQLCNITTNMKRLQKAAKQTWAKLASEGVHSILPSAWYSQSLGLKGQAWGYISVSDVLFLVEEKYDVVTQVLYTEMLQEHHTQSVWETLLPWQQIKEVEALETVAEEALQSADMLSLSFLPGAFRIYKSSCFKWKEQSWSAVALLIEVHAFCQQERNELMVLGQRLSCESLRLLCLHIILAIYRAQREKMSYSALLASRQSWESWPQVVSPCTAERVNLWLQNEDKGEDRKEHFEALQKMTELQLLVLTQEEERKLLLKLVHGIALEDLQESGRTISPKDSGGFDAEQTSLRADCIKRLKQIHAQLQRQNGTENNSEKTSIQIKIQENWSQPVVADCTLLLLTRLMELQEVQASALLQVLQHQDSQAALMLKERYEAELKTKRFTNLLHLLNPEDPLNPGSLLAENTSGEQIGPGLSCTGEVGNICERSVPAAAPDLIDRASGECVEAGNADGSVQQEVCSGCGAVMEELPYLEILSVPDAQAQAASPEAGACRKEGSSETKSLESFEKQGSLIPLAWSKPPEEDTDYSAEDEAGEADQYQDFPSTAIQVQSTQCEETVQHPIPEQPHKGEAAPEKDPSSLAEDLPQFSSNDGGSTPTPSASRELTESELWDIRGSELSGPEDLIHSQESTHITSSLSGRATTLETNPLGREEIIREQAVERERTMRNLVDMQRRFEERHQRDKERQRFRVQERLSIIQNRKAEEDLLGLKHTDRLKHLTQDLPLEDKAQQKTVVRERLEQLRRERSYIMQSKRDRNTAGFKELLAPVALHNSEAEDGAN